MLNVFNMEFRRMFKQKAFRVTTIIISVLSFLLVYVASLSMYDDGERANLAETVKMFLSEGFFLIIMGVFVVLYITYEYNNGYIKNYIGQIKSRLYLVAAQLISIVLYSIFIFLYIFVFTYICLLIFEHEVNIGLDSDMIKYFVLTWLLYLTLFAIFAFFSFLCRSNAIPMVVMIFIANGATMIFAELINFSYYRLFDSRIHVEKFLPSQYMYEIEAMVAGKSEEFAGSYFGRYTFSVTGFLILLAVYVVVFSTLSCVAMKKRDIV